MASEQDLVARWRELHARYYGLACPLDRALQEEHGLGLSEFETLDRLSADDCDKRRMSELAADMYLSQSALSRTVARLERNGLVVRTMCEEDRRSIFVTLTGLGRERHESACKTHRAILAEHLE